MDTIRTRTQKIVDTLGAVAGVLLIAVALLLVMASLASGQESNDLMYESPVVEVSGGAARAYLLVYDNDRAGFMVVHTNGMGMLAGPLVEEDAGGANVAFCFKTDYVEGMSTPGQWMGAKRCFVVVDGVTAYDTGDILWGKNIGPPMELTDEPNLDHLPTETQGEVWRAT